jgi:hypothetical protein
VKWRRRLHQILGDLKPYEGDQWRTAACPRCGQITGRVTVGQRIDCWYCRHVYEVGGRRRGGESGEVERASGDEPPGECEQAHNEHDDE